MTLQSEFDGMAVPPDFSGWAVWLDPNSRAIRPGSNGRAVRLAFEGMAEFSVLPVAIVTRRIGIRGHGTVQYWQKWFDGPGNGLRQAVWCWGQVAKTRRYLRKVTEISSGIDWVEQNLVPRSLRREQCGRSEQYGWFSIG